MTTRGGIQDELAALAAAGTPELRARWRRAFQAPPPALSRDLLLRALAYRLQEEAEGGLPKPVQRRLRGVADEIAATGSIAAPAPILRPGTRLVREWHGRTHTVTVAETGFEYAGTSYRSLSEIARTITGARWSGPRFFGLRQGARSPASASATRSPPRRKRGCGWAACRRSATTSTTASSRSTRRRRRRCG